MTEDYVIVKEEVVDVLGHKVKVVTERFSDEYLSSRRFQPRCLRCIFNPSRPSICQYLYCTLIRDEAIHFEELKDQKNVNIS